MKNKKKGFSLVELIVVIAIMAVLVGVLAPSLLSYVEKARVQRDASAVGEVVRVTGLALMDSSVGSAASAGNTLTILADGTFEDDLSGTDNGKLAGVVSLLIDNVNFASPNCDDVTITITSLVGSPTFSITTTATNATWKAAIEGVN